jgi:dTDP-4-amino-4,6-dideoxygalactose transaminase
MQIAVMRPRLPEAAKIARYLERIDSTRIYANFGPLNASVEERLSAVYGSAERVVTTVANATVGLALALEAQDVKRGGLCVMPAWTFVASAHAAVLAGLTPYFVDVDANTWALDPRCIEAQITGVAGDVAAIMPVAPFGQELDAAAWAAFRERTSIPVVIDAAAGFDTAQASSVPTVVSLHATKSLGIGEGGFVMSTDSALLSEVRMRSNFGFNAGRRAQMPATNGKLSEYDAAVALAALDEWPAARAQWMEVAGCYREALQNSPIRLQPGFGERWAGSTCVLQFPGQVATLAETALAAAEVETRRWWGDGAHRHPATRHFPAASLATTEALLESTAAVPFYRDLSPETVKHVVGTLLAIDMAVAN